ncbi:MAG TPA: ATP-binding protein [Gemmatimonadaceae bacterium]|nr:ATP-binding protein [Gemmatimonadaceae bacterium]
MPTPLRDLFAGRIGGRRAVETISAHRTFADVILPPRPRQALDEALAQVRSHELIFHQWGLGERHSSGLGLAFNFAGPPGTGKTICAEAIANALGRKLLSVRYAEMESMWVGETPKNVAAVFRMASEEGAVLFFDEADAIASRRSTGPEQGYQRESNTVVSVLLRELEAFNGVVIFATNLAVNFDPAFERRIRTHVLFEMPGVDEREQIWKVQVHPLKTPLAADVDFRSLAERFEGSGGDIKNAVLKAATAAAAGPGLDVSKTITQWQLEHAMAEVLSAKGVMNQSLFTPEQSMESRLMEAVAGAEQRWRSVALTAVAVGGIAALLGLISLVVTLAR